MGKLNQIIAVEKGIKQKRDRAFTDAYHVIQKGDLFNGLARRYQPHDEEGEPKPPESKVVQQRAEDLLKGIAAALTESFDITATKDYANCQAKADVMVDGKVLLTQVPVTHLLYLEKQLADVAVVVGKMPTLDPSEVWSWSDDQNCHATAPVATISNKKVFRNHVKSPATDKHPAQVEVYTEDVPVGTWTQIKYSGAMPAQRKREILDRIEVLQRAIKCAREHANMIDVSGVKVGDPIFGYLFS